MTPAVSIANDRRAGWRRRMPAIVWLVLVTLTFATAARAQNCPQVPDDIFAFIDPGDDRCPADPGVFWPAGNVIYQCGFFTDDDKLIDCGASASTCAQICHAAAEIWNTDLPGRFSFFPATDATTVEFCDTEDGRVSVGGTTTLCDGTTYGNNTLAVTLSIFFNTGSQAGQLIDANITVNKKFRFSQGSFQATLAHEFGHVLGLAHPDQCGENFNVLMRSSSRFPSGDPCFVRDPASADINGAERIYAVTSPVPTLTPVPTPTPVATPGLCGDADLSGAITLTDGVQTLRAAAGLPSPCTPERCDMDDDGTISVSDGVHVLRGAAGLSFTAECP